jgi:hypothetical protein
MKISATTRKYFSFVLLVGIVVWLLGVLLHPFEPRYQEPQYQGKKLTDWQRRLTRVIFSEPPLFNRIKSKMNRQSPPCPSAAIIDDIMNALKRFILGVGIGAAGGAGFAAGITRIHRYLARWRKRDVLSVCNRHLA